MSNLVGTDPDDSTVTISKQRLRWLMLAALGLTLSACSGDGPSSAVVVRDSAGVTIVESMAPQWAEGEGWRLSEEPVVTIGIDDGPEEYSLFKVAATLRLPNGHIVIANGGSNDLRYYDSSGVYLNSVGRDGFGPGEFKEINGVWLVADSLVVSDYGNRAAVFSAAGEFGRTLTLHTERGVFPSEAVGVFGDGSILGRLLVFDRDAQSESGFQVLRNEVVYRRFSPDCAFLDSLGVFLWVEVVMETIETEIDKANDFAMSRAVGAVAPFSRTPSTIAFGDFLYHGSSESYEIQVYTKEGLLRRVFRKPIPNPPVTERDKERFRDEWLEGSGDWGRSRIRDLVFPETQPAYGEVKVDALGNVWVAEFSLGREDRSGNWTVFDPDGRMLGVVQFPWNGRKIVIGEDYLMGMWRTELDVEQVRMYRLYRH